MATELHTFDPDGDLLLIFGREAPGEPESDHEPSADGRIYTPAGSEIQRDDEGGAMDLGDPEEPAVERDIISLADLSGDHAPEDDADCEKSEPDTMFHMLVSSKHMMLASPMFKSMLQSSTFQEGRNLASAGTVKVPLLPDDDPTAFIIILDIIHGRNKNVPRKIDLEMLTKISMIVDKYQMESIPTKYVTDEDIEYFHRWLGMSWVFGKGSEFKAMTKRVERGCYHNLAEDLEEGLPIPDRIIDSISTKRQVALFRLYGLIKQTIRRYQRPDILCPRTDSAEWRLQCDSLLLGSLLKSAAILGIMPFPASPYRDVSINEMTAKLYSLDVKALCDPISKTTFIGQYPMLAHGLKLAIHARIESVEKNLSGLDIQDFKTYGKSIRPVFGV